MAVIFVGEKRDGKEGSQVVGSITDRRTFIVRTDNQQDGRVTVLAAAGLPRMFDLYQTDTDVDHASHAIRRNARQTSRFVWEVTIEYSTEVEFESEEVQDFLGVPIRVAISWVKDQEVIEGSIEEVSQNPDKAPLSDGAVNSAGEPFDPPVTKDVSRMVLTFHQNEPTYSILRARRYVDRINSDPWFGFGPQELKMEAIVTPGKQSVIQNDIPVQFYPIQYVIAVNLQTWNKFILNQGTFYREGGIPGVRKAFLTEEGFPRIGLLAADGDKLEAGEDSTYTQINAYLRDVFGALGLPAEMP